MFLILTVINMQVLTAHHIIVGQMELLLPIPILPVFALPDGQDLIVLFVISLINTEDPIALKIIVDPIVPPFLLPQHQDAYVLPDGRKMLMVLAHYVLPDGRKMLMVLAHYVI